MTDETADTRPALAPAIGMNATTRSGWRTRSPITLADRGADGEFVFGAHFLERGSGPFFWDAYGRAYPQPDPAYDIVALEPGDRTHTSREKDEYFREVEPQWFEFFRAPHEGDVYVFIAAAYQALARDIVFATKGGSERAVALRKLLESRDAFMRTLLRNKVSLW